MNIYHITHFFVQLRYNFFLGGGGEEIERDHKSRWLLLSPASTASLISGVDHLFHHHLWHRTSSPSLITYVSLRSAAVPPSLFRKDIFDPVIFLTWLTVILHRFRISSSQRYMVSMFRLNKHICDDPFWWVLVILV